MEENEIRKFLKGYWLPVIQRLIDQRLEFIALFLIGQSIEFLGAFLDNKPFKARQQSKIRFRSSLVKLFPSSYARVNQNDWLYDKLRSQMSHVLIPSSGIRILSGKKTAGTHLLTTDKRLNIDVERFYTDLHFAVEKLFHLMDEGRIKEKKMGGLSMEYLELPELK